MKILGFQGSPRTKGKCSRLLTRALEGAASKGAEVHTNLIGAQCGRAGAVGKRRQLPLLDAVLHLPAGAVELFVEGLRLNPRARQAGDHETRVSFFAEVPARLCR